MTQPTLAVRIHLGDTPQAPAIHHPVASTAEGLKLMERIRSTNGMMILGAETDAPVLFNCRHVVMVVIVNLVAPPAPNTSQLARLPQ
jgi:hypothetical protein